MREMVSVCCSAPIVLEAPGSGDLSVMCAQCHRSNPDRMVAGEPIRDHGTVVTAPAGTPQETIIDKLMGTGDLPPHGQELGRPPAKPPFDPHEGREVDHGREFGGEMEPMVTTLVFFGVDQGGDFEDAVQGLVAEAEKLGLRYVTATVGRLDLESHIEAFTDIAEMTMTDEEDDDEPEEKPERLDEEPI